DLGYNKSDEAFTIQFAADRLSVESDSLGPLQFGIASQVGVETTNNGSGNLVCAQKLNIGNTLTVFAIIRDQYGNFIDNPAYITWNLIAKTGGMADSDLNSTTGASVTLTGNQKGTAIIHPTCLGLISVDSGTITVAKSSNGGGSGGGGGGGGNISAAEVFLSGLTSTAILQVDNNGIAQNSVQLKTLDGKVILEISQNCKLITSYNSALTILTAAVLDSPPVPLSGEIVILSYDFGPEGAKFDPGVILTMNYDPETLPEKVIEKDLCLAYYDGTKWQSLEGKTDIQAKTVSANITQCSSVGLIGQFNETEPTIITPTPSIAVPSSTPSSKNPLQSNSTDKLLPLTNTTQIPAVTSSPVTMVPTPVKKTLSASPPIITSEIEVRQQNAPETPPPSIQAQLSKQTLVWLIILTVAVLLITILVVALIRISHKKIKNK
ncbi:MAG: hypothetical protein JXA46_01810, partial [Dehalococcoidales bacterium]|nr:hypothetical protein [Dehalococcoidales bacterium]